MRRDGVITLVVIGLILSLAILYAWLAITTDQDTSPAKNPAQDALTVPEGERSFTNLLGEPLSLDDHLGKVLVVNAWASWSPESARELKTLALLSREYHQEEVVVLAINRAEPASTAKRFLDSIGVADDVLLVFDPADRYYRSIGGYTMPETVFYDAAGNITHQQHGALSLQQMLKYTEEARTGAIQ